MRIAIVCLFTLCPLALSSCQKNTRTLPQPSSSSGPTPSGVTLDDENLWLEELKAEKSIAWVKEQNLRTTSELERDARYPKLKQRFLEILNSKTQIPWPEVYGKHVYNFWQDDKNPRGLWRRTSLLDYRRDQPRWETVLDLDALAAKEKENWVWDDDECFYPKFERCLLQFSRGGGDAVVVREFDVVKKRFVTEGFNVPEAKTSIHWKTLDSVFIATNEGPSSLTDSGYPRIVREWKRGTKRDSATIVFEGTHSDIDVSAMRLFDHGGSRDVVIQRTNFFSAKDMLIENGKLVPLLVPEDSSVELWGDQALVLLRSDWKVSENTYRAGSFVATSLANLQAGNPQLQVLFAPSANESLLSTASLKSAVVLNLLRDVKTRQLAWTYTGGKWSQRELTQLGTGHVTVRAIADGERDDFLVDRADFVTPLTLSLGTLNAPPEVLKRAPVAFAAEGVVVEQHHAVSADGTRVPYFQVGKPADSPRPTLIYGYGGFEEAELPHYMSITGAGWLERGGVFVLANIRGGGEFGPSWHKAAQREHKQRSYDDFIAIAQDLVARQVTTVAKLGIEGGSNGGLLVGAVMTQRPDLFGAVLCQSPLLDMRRFHKLLAGASWMEEYGDPDNPNDWAFISKYSPYQNVSATKKYPRVMFTSAVSDDRVHPAHARKMAARMLAQHHDVLYHENLDGGHAGAANNEQWAALEALAFTFLSKQLDLP